MGFGFESVKEFFCSDIPRGVEKKIVGRRRKDNVWEKDRRNQVFLMRFGLTLGFSGLQNSGFRCIAII